MFVEFSSTVEWLIERCEFDAARKVAQTVFERYCGNYQAARFKMKTCLKISDFAGAAETARLILKENPDCLDTLLDFSSALTMCGRIEEARDVLENIFKRQPYHSGAAVNLALTYSVEGRVDAAAEIYESLLRDLPANDPNRKGILFNLSWFRFREGKLAEAVAMANQAGTDEFWTSVRKAPTPPLRAGTNLSGKEIFVCGAGGAGDEIINARFAGKLANQGAHVTWVTEHGMTSLLSRVPGIQRCISRAAFESAGKYENWTPASSLPALLNLTINDVLCAPYVTALPEETRKFREKLKNTQNLKVGIRWKGNPFYHSDILREVQFKSFEKFFGIKDVDFYSLQRDQGREQLSRDSGVIDWADDLATWEDTAGAIANMDLVISSCTSIIHLAAAMGKPAWLFCPLFPYYVWAMPGDKSLWYSSVRIFRQKRLGSWDEPRDEMFRLLKERQIED